MSGNKPWGGRFADRTSELTEAYTASVEWDKSLFAEDIRGSMAHAVMLARQGVITEHERDALLEGLAKVEEEIRSGSFEWSPELEDVHMNIETRLTAIVGEAGKKLHTGRSRNDQVALDFRMYVAACLKAWREQLLLLMEVLIGRAELNVDTLMPGCTHFQPAQPVSLGHHLLAYACMFRRDAERISGALARTEISPLGAAAFAGTTYPLDPSFTARELSLRGVFLNSMDAVSDRDFVAEGLFTGSLIMMHLSRLCEEIIIWANPAFGYVRLPDGFATGSSIMPQKKNPDVAELMRGKTGRVFGDLVAVLTMLKGLPLAYNRDMQEDKEPFFDTHRTVESSLKIMAAMLEKLGFNEAAMRLQMAKGFINATELADYLVSKGLAFRDAHHVTGRAVGVAEAAGKGLEELSLGEFQVLDARIEPDVFEALDYAGAVRRRSAPGGTGQDSVRRQIEELRAWIGTARSAG